MPVRCCYEDKGICILAAIVLDVQSGSKSNFFLPFMGVHDAPQGTQTGQGTANYASQIATRKRGWHAAADAIS